ncbi:MAG: DUF979 domain-containing protein [Planctomycetes bacterium]|nr:DUF979 domain-containing protein [Planctomycetota bacterium]
MIGTRVLAAVWIDAEWLHAVAGLVLLVVAAQIACDRRHPRRAGSATFWGVLGATFFARLVPVEWTLASGSRAVHGVPVAVGIAMVGMVLLVAAKQVRAPGARADEAAARTSRQAEARRLGNRLIGPLVVLALVAAGGVLLLPKIAFGGRALVAANQANTIAVGMAAVIALLFAQFVTRRRDARDVQAAAIAPERFVAVREGGVLLQHLGGALILPQLLATLGGVFDQNGVGDVIAHHVAHGLPVAQPLLAVVAYCVAMPLFTILMGNAFAAFPLITLGIGLPFIVRQHGGDPAIMGAFGMLCGYCGTLVTPMAANFNVVPGILLGIRDRHAVIKAQAPFALACWLFNVAAMAALVYRK